MKVLKFILLLFGAIQLSMNSASAEPVTREIVIYYQTSWSAAYISYSADHAGWTTTPGELMAVDIPGFYSLTIPASSLEFVFNNGMGEWDHSVSGGNFNVVAPGTYLIAHNEIIPVADQTTRLESKIKIHYDTGWPEAYMHFSEDGTGWASGNDHEMSDSAVYPNEKYFQWSATTLEFVTTDGFGAWDHPANGGNYQIDIPGEYRLSNGQLTRIKVASVLDEPEWLVALFANSASATPYDGGYTVTLTGLPATLIAFTDRPDRNATKIEMATFFAGWDTAFGATPPNAAFTGVTATGQEQETVLTLTNPIYDSVNGSVAFQAALVPGADELSEYNYTDVHLFIDGIWEGTLYPDNVNRLARLNELVGDVNTVFTDAHYSETKITLQLQQINEKAQAMYGEIQVPLPPIIETEITPGYAIYAIDLVAPILVYKAVKKGLQKLAVTFLKREGRIGLAAFREIIQTPRWMKFGPTAGAVVVAVGVDLAIDGVTGAHKRSNLQSGIHDLIPLRITLKKAQLVNAAFLEALQVVNDSLEDMIALGYTKEQLDALLTDRLQKRVTDDIENTITDQYTIDYLNDFDAQRGSWTNEDQ